MSSKTIAAEALFGCITMQCSSQKFYHLPQFGNNQEPMGMTGIWLLSYRINNSVKDRYIDWFENTHIAEKLARDGYDWAAHFEAPRAAETEDTSARFIAMFGALSTRTFLDPSPAQIKPHQNDLTREMIALRERADSWIVTEEWSQSGSENNPERPMVNSPVIRLSVFADTADAQSLGATCAQQYFPTVARLPEHVIVRKWLATVGTTRHLVLEEMNEEANLAASAEAPGPSDLLQQSLSPASPVVAGLRCFARSAPGASPHYS